MFGTGECNTDMIRAENAITALLRADANVHQSDKRSGTLITINRFSGILEQLKADGSNISVTIPEWADKQKFSM